ncbi:glycosyltransferase [Clostridium butyricum]|uniref:Glycosyltransferase n=1 Tax=Clostridium butyricum TaxID=1492 RepID=A0AAP9RBV3_CLOBU|nr:glycosyltransferase [Clostridium butyricum]MBZ5745736.1 glycosyltransferase [Clostridium butyricum]MDB2151755.1 glycosyltransferase [Clostridium butyricum]MDI9210737.1 glycosyltransferase [Clostridium butyricum]QMW89748.1 glycosyltransferase [Clostridium butyricum]BBK78188.1 biofilm formation protein PslC [Clostridium butyricum]
MKISIICPIYNGQDYIEKLHNNILMQKLESEQTLQILYALTRGRDRSQEILEGLKDSRCDYTLIEPKDFSHSTTREMMSKKAKGEIIVFISQDIKIKNDLWLKNLVNPIIKGECEASFSRQIGEDDNIEKYTRERNYPAESRTVSKNEIDKYQIRTFFYSDASSAVLTKVYRELNAYDGKRMPTNEDMYFAHKLINAGYRIKYCADSEVYHSHDFTYRQLYKRYYDTGIFFKQNKYFKDYKSNESGVDLAKYVFKRSIEEKNFKVAISVLPNFAVRFIAKLIGEH